MWLREQARRLVRGSKRYERGLREKPWVSQRGVALCHWVLRPLPTDVTQTMNILSVDDNFINVLLPVVKEYENDDNLCVTEVHQEIGADKGQNYMSIVFRMRVKGHTGNGNEYRNTFIRKTKLGQGKFATNARTNELFGNEVYVYAKLLPLLGTFAPDCLIVNKDEIIMEDLKQFNYSMCERRNLLDHKHCIAVIKTLATLHATSFNLKLQSPKIFEKMVQPLTENIYPSDGRASIGSYIESSLEYAIKTLESIDPQTEQIIRAGNFLKQYRNKVIDIMKSLLAPETSKRNHWVLTHGDTWNNNIMFRYHSNGNIESVKLVDFQVARHSSPALDVGYFLYISARSEVLNDINELIKLYEDEFMRVLRSLVAPNANLDGIFEPGWFSSEFKFYSLFGFFSALMVLHAVYMDDSQIDDLEMNKSQNELTEEKHHIVLTPEKTERITFIVAHYLSHFS